MKFDYVVAEEVAVNDVKEFVEHFLTKEQDEDLIKDKYPNLVQAVKFGLLSFDDEILPIYKLKEPIKTLEGSIAVSDLTFNNRISYNEKKRLMKGLDPTKDSVEVLMRCQAYIIKQPVGMLDKLGRFDDKVIQEITSLFL